MSDKKLLEELKNVKKQQEKLQRKIDGLEAKISSSTREEEFVSGEQEPSGSSSAVPLIVIGVVLTFTVIGALIGIPLIILGIYRLATESPAQDTGDVVDEEVEPEENVEINKDTILKWLGRGGITLTVIGVAFFINYAIELGYLGFGARLLLAGAFGLGLVGVGHKLGKIKSYNVLSKFLSVGGFIITYFTVFSSYFFEDYREAVGMTFPFASLLLGAVVIAMIYYMMTFGNAATTGLAYLLGYFTVVLSRGEGLITIVYLVLLTLSGLYLSYHKKWDLLPASITVMNYLFSILVLSFSGFDSVEFFFLSGVFVAIHLFSEFYLRSDKYIITKSLNNVLYTVAVAVSLFNHQYIEYFFFVLAASLFFSYLISKAEESKYTDLIGSIVAIVIYSLLDLSSILTTAFWGALAVFNAFVYSNNKEVIFRLATYFFSTILFVKNVFYDTLFHTAPYFDGLVQESTVLMSLSIISYLVVIYVLDSDADRNVFSVASMLLAAIALSTELSDLSFAIGFILGSLALFGLHEFKKLVLVRAGSYIYLGVGILSGLVLLADATSQAVISNEAAVLFFSVGVLIAYSFKETEKISKVLAYLGFSLFLLTVAFEFSNFIITMIWGLTGLILLSVGMNMNKTGLRNSGLIALSLAVLKLFVIDTIELDVLYRTIAYIGLGLILLLATFVFSKYKDTFTS